MSAHRAAWTVAHGAIPDGLHVLHKCDVRPCINPDHLFLGTCKDNMVDKAMKGRAAAKDDRRGALNSRAILTEEQAQEIASSPATQHELARKYGVSRGAISGIKTGKNWKHLHYRNGDQNHG